MNRLSALKLFNHTSSHTKNTWNSLNMKLVKNKTVILQGFGDLHPYKDGPKFLAEKLFVRRCDKNFVFYWINKQTFPNMKELYLLSHPCEPRVLRQNIPTIYLADNFHRYKKRWAEDLDNEGEMELYMSIYSNEQPELEDLSNINLQRDQYL